MGHDHVMDMNRVTHVTVMSLNAKMRFPVAPNKKPLPLISARAQIASPTR